MKDTNKKLVTFETCGVGEISKDIYSTASQNELFPDEFEFLEQKANRTGLLLEANVVQHILYQSKEKEILSFVEKL